MITLTHEAMAVAFAAHRESAERTVAELRAQLDLERSVSLLADGGVRRQLQEATQEVAELREQAADALVANVTTAARHAKEVAKLRRELGAALDVVADVNREYTSIARALGFGNDRPVAIAECVAAAAELRAEVARVEHSRDTYRALLCDLVAAWHASDGGAGGAEDIAAHMTRARAALAPEAGKL